MLRVGSRDTLYTSGSVTFFTVTACHWFATPLQRRRCIVVRGIGCILLLTTVGTKTRRVHRGRGAMAESVMHHCLVGISFHFDPEQVNFIGLDHKSESLDENVCNVVGATSVEGFSGI